MKIKLIYKFIIVFILISVVPLSIIGIKMVDINKISLQEATRNNHITTARFLAESIDNFILSLKEKLLFLISSQSVQLLDFNGKQALLQALISSSDYFITVSMMTSQGEEYVKTYHPDYSSEAEIKNIGETGLFQKAKNGPAISDIYKVNDEPRMDIIYPVGKGYIFITITLNSLWNKIRNAEIGEKSVVFLVDKNGMVICHPDKSIEGEILSLPSVEAVITRGSLGSIEYEIEGKKMVSAYCPVVSMSWGIVTQQPHEYAYASAIRLRKNAYKWIIIAIFIAIIISHFLARGLSRPIIKLIKGAEQVARGDFTQEVKVSSNDELSLLASTFNNMVSSLNEYNEMQIDKIIEEQTKTEAIIFSIEDGIVLTDFDGKIMLVNNRAKELLDIDRNPREGDYISDYLNSDVLIAVFKDLKDMEVNISTDKSQKIIKMITEKVTSTTGRKIGNMRIIRDVTLEKEIEEIKVRFLQSITHDLKNPLAAIMGMADLLVKMRGDNINELESKYFTVLKTEADRLMGMISDILNLARLEAGKMTLNNIEFDITKLIKNIKDTFFAQAENSGVKLNLETEEKLIINADKKLIERVIINLLGNALKYTPRNGTISLRARGCNNVIEVVVADTGDGIPTDMHKLIFDRFQQGKGQSMGGTGIGLNVAKEIVEAHKGRIWVESEPDHGAEFKFTLPKNL